MAGVCLSFMSVVGVLDANCMTSLGDLVNQWRKDVLELERISTSEGPNLVETLNLPLTYCWSPALIPKPLDWGSHIGKALLVATTTTLTRY